MGIKDRLSVETEFHNRKYSQKNNEPAHYVCNPTYMICQNMINALGSIAGKSILECGCGNGWMTVELASRGANVFAFDISGESVKETISFLARKKLSDNCIVEQKAAEELDYGSEKFDIIIGFAVLHHVDMNKVIPLLHQMLKKNGLFVFAEPMRGNPLLDLYRKLTPEYRTPEERPFTIKELKAYLGCFDKISHTEYYLFALLPLFLTNIKIFIFMKKYIDNFAMLDSWLFSVFPSLRRFAWYTQFKCIK